MCRHGCWLFCECYGNLLDFHVRTPSFPPPRSSDIFVPPSPPAIRSTMVQGATRTGRVGSVPLVLDMSTLWAGPLCGHLLERMGATVIKVESPSRVDGARRGNAHFYALLNQGKQCLSLDPATAEGRAQLLCLIGRADIVIDSSRPARTSAVLGKRVPGRGKL